MSIPMLFWAVGFEWVRNVAEIGHASALLWRGGWLVIPTKCRLELEFTLLSPK